MRRLILALTLLVTQSVHAKDHIVIPTDVYCFKVEVLLKQLRDNFGEEPIVIGKSDLDRDATTMVFVNQQTGSYTVVTIGKSIGCILDTGNSVRYRMPKLLENKTM